MMKTAKLLLHCPDKPGILAEVTDFITVNKGNIIYLDQYVDHVENIFFMRIEWELENFLVPQEKIEDYFETLYAQKYGMSFRLYFSDAKPRMAIFVSKMSHCLFDLLARYTAGEWNVEIPLIISNHPDLQHVAERFGIPFHLFPITKETKEEQEKKEMELLAKHKVNFIVLARYMQVISEKMINAYPNRIINIHHSFLPAFVGAKPYHAAFERGSLGGGNHFIELDQDENGCFYVIIHSGSRCLGKNIFDHYMKKGQKYLKKQGLHVPYELTWLEGGLKEQYLNDLELTQQFAALNRKAILDELLRGMKWKADTVISCQHNYVDQTQNPPILRKGAISAQKDEPVIIPIHMKDGVILGKGLGNPDWNCSAPHGAGRIMKRVDVGKHWTLSDYKKEMKGIYSPSISRRTLDEAPFAYRSLEEIRSAAADAVSIEKILRPVYNFKAGEEA